MTQDEADQLFVDNMNELDKLENHSNGAISGLLDALEKNGPIYIRLKNPESTSVQWEFVESQKSNWRETMQALAQRLGLNMDEHTISTHQV